MSATVKAVSFDLWDTIIDDDSDEPKRLEKGLGSKYDDRRRLLFKALRRHGPTSLTDVRIAFDAADAAFNKAWKEDFVTWPIAERLEVALEALNRTLPAAELAALADALGTMEIDVPPDPIAGVEDALKELSSRYKLCVVSDAIVTPGAKLRRLLGLYDLDRYFQGFAFSDEIGRSKPDRAMFEAAAGQLGVELAAMVHVGDRDHNDVRGPHALGMKAVLFTAKRDADAATTAADAVCDSHARLPAVIDGLAATG